MWLASVRFPGGTVSPSPTMAARRNLWCAPGGHTTGQHRRRARHRSIPVVDRGRPPDLVRRRRSDVRNKPPRRVMHSLPQQDQACHRLPRSLRADRHRRGPPCARGEVARSGIGPQEWLLTNPYRTSFLGGYRNEHEAASQCRGHRTRLRSEPGPRQAVRRRTGRPRREGLRSRPQTRDDRSAGRCADSARHHRSGVVTPGR